MHILLSVPPALSDLLPRLPHILPQGCFATHDPVDRKLGSGGGTAHLLATAWRSQAPDRSFTDWLGGEKRILLHAGGQSRRLPAYAPTGKALLPMPVFRWMSGQRLDQTLLDVQLPLLQHVLDAAPAGLRTLVASGDVLVWNDAALPPLPDVDVLCLGLWDSPGAASHHGVFFTPRAHPEQFEFMRQKPSVEDIQALAPDHLFLLDVGIWLFSDQALEVLMRKCGWEDARQGFPEDGPRAYDLYTAFGEALGRRPTAPDPEVSALRCAVLPLAQGEFYHFGTSADVIRSSLALQNRVNDQRRIRSPLIKPHPAIFIQNSRTACGLGPDNREIWIENSHIAAGWTLRDQHVLTGVPPNEWTLDLPAGACLDFVPFGADGHAIRFHGFHDPFRGDTRDAATHWLGRPAPDWFARRGLDAPAGDLQGVPLFPVLAASSIEPDFLAWLLAEEPRDRPDFRALYLGAEKRSADELAAGADLARLFRSRHTLLRESLPALARHAHRSIFHQIDLFHAATLYAETEAPLPAQAPDPVGQLFPYIHDRMFQAAVQRRRGHAGDAEEAQAFEALRRAIIEPLRRQTVLPRNTALSDQVIWARSPVRLDLAGGWTDTPPYCFLHGGRVVNLAVELNGQPPIQVFARTCAEPHVVLRSIDLGSSTELETYEQIGDYARIGSGFSIPLAALALAGFHPDFQGARRHASLREQLREFGGGIELSLLCAVPKGSGLGTSSILAATTLGALSELCGLQWDTTDLGNRSLALEQMLTSGGGWQDQYGGITRGLKLLRSAPGLEQTPELRWLPDYLFTDPLHKSHFLLYYTGITRVAKNLLAEIVRGMFLNRHGHLATLDALGHHAMEVYETLQRGDYDSLGRKVRRTWQLNQQLDPGTNPPEIQRMLAPIDDSLLGMKLLGAGGGGYLLMLAKDAACAARVRQHLAANPPNDRARFVDFALSDTGMRITRS